MNEWERSAQTYNPDARRRYADEAADRHNVFRRDGFQMFGRLAPETLDLIHNGLKDVKGTFRANVLIDYDIDIILSNLSLRDIAMMPQITRIAAMHIGAEPKIIDVSLWETVEGDGEREAAQRWHRDVDDWRACKLFVYLTDVGPDQGPHLFVPGTHRYEYFEARGMAPDKYFFMDGSEHADVIDTLPRIEVTGPAGTMFMENTYCFHRGLPVRKGHRMVFQVCYGLMDLEKMMPGTKIPKIRAAWG